MAEERVVVEVELRVQRDHPVIAGEDQRIDLGERGIGRVKALVQRLEQRASLRQRGLRDADAERDFVRIRIGEALRRIDEHLADLFRRLGGDFLDVHAALGRRHQHDFLRAAVDHHAGIHLFLDVGAFFDEEAPHLLAFGPGLVGFELHAQDLFRPRAHLVDRLRELDAAALAAAAGADLRLHHPDLAAKLLRRLDRFVDAHRREAARRRHAVLAEDLLALVLVDFHAALPLNHFGYQSLTVSVLVSSA